MKKKDTSLFDIEDQINTVKNGLGHVVILCAGASKAASLHNKEKNGFEIPLMNDLPNVIDLRNELKDIPEKLKRQNFELIFSTIHSKEGNSERLQTIEGKIRKYFSNLQLPDTPTIYDYLVLSLRNKDLIATFNWDPFLTQAYVRNFKFTSNLPQLSFLHGSVAVGLCYDSQTYGLVGHNSRHTGKPLKDCRLLYPIEHKNYNGEEFIKSQWDLLANHLKNPCRVTIFGYSAPETDIEAISLMKAAWGNKEKDHIFTQFEVIDIAPENKLFKSWEKFIFSHHYEITNDFFQSTIVRFPRRSGESFWATYMENSPYDYNYPPQFKTLEEMWNWFEPFINAENKKNVN